MEVKQKEIRMFAMAQAPQQSVNTPLTSDDFGHLKSNGAYVG